MEKSHAVDLLEALAHEVRLAVVRALVPAGPEGLAAGAIAERVGLAPSTLSFHLHRLVTAGLVTSTRRGRRIFYAVRYARLAGLVAYLAEDCCARAPEGCLPECPGVTTGAAAGETDRGPACTDEDPRRRSP